MSESAIDLELLFNSVCADHRRDRSGVRPRDHRRDHGRKERVMYQSNVFSVARAWHALRTDLHQQSRAVLVGTCAAAAVILIANVFSPEPTGTDFHGAFFPLALVAGGLLFTSTLFSELPDKPRAHAYLTLPISTLERWAVRLLLSTVGYAAVALAGYFLVTLLGAGISQLIRGWSHPVFTPSDGRLAHRVAVPGDQLAVPVRGRSISGAGTRSR